MDRIVQDLSNEKWQCEHIRPGQGLIEEFHKIPCERQGAAFNWIYVKVPGDVYSDLHRVSEVEDPLFGQNMAKLKWVQEKEFWYMCKFNLDDDMSGKNVEINFEGVDFSCDVWFNGKEMGHHEGMFSPFKYDVTEIANHENWPGGSNILLVKLDPPPRNFERVSGMKNNYNGDYHTGLVPFGIWRPVKVIATEAACVRDVHVETKIAGTKADLTVEVAYESRIAAKTSLELKLTIEGENCDAVPVTVSKTIEAEQGEGLHTFEFTVNDPLLWYPWDLGDQNLHNAVVQVIVDGQVVDSYTQRFGIRQVTMAMNPGYTADEAENPWTFVINGKKMYMRGACWGGQPSILYGKNSYEKYESLLNMVKEANINHLRIFGWHVPEVPEFYDLCDELGITVWTNFTFSTNVLRPELPFADAMVEACMDIVVDRRNHPSNIIWMGGEEVFFTDAHAISGNVPLLKRIGEEIKHYTTVPYAIASPLSNETGIKMGFKTKESQHANEHYYGAGHVFMEDYYPSLDCCIIPELTAASAPGVDSLKRFIPEDELWPMGMSWAYHYADIDVLKILNIEALGDIRMGSLEEFVRATQETHAIVLQYALEHYRRRKPYNSGVALCHFITHWPDIKWGIVDYYGKKKDCFQQVKHTYEPVLISLAHSKRRWNAGESFEGSVWVVNDYHKTFSNAVAAYEVKDDAGNVLTSGKMDIATIGEDSAFEISGLTFTVAEGQYFYVSLKLLAEDGVTLSTNDYKLIVGDQEEAKKQLKAMRVEADERIDKYPGFYRYFPEAWDEINAY